MNVFEKGARWEDAFVLRPRSDVVSSSAAVSANGKEVALYIPPAAAHPAYNARKIADAKLDKLQ